MKTRFNTYDIVSIVTELQRLVGMRVNQVYDIDNKCYLIRLQRSEEKTVLLLESGNRFHTTQFEWPKNVAPSGFTMKLRKHLKNKRLEKLCQLGNDRIVEFQFGSNEAAYHVILELYDRGNIVLTDYELTILNVLRPHVEGDKIRFAVKEKYPLDRAKSWCDPPSGEALKEIFLKCKPGDNLKKILNPNLEYGASIIDHVLLEHGLAGNMKLTPDPGGKGFNVERDLTTLETAITRAEDLLQSARSVANKGYIIQKKEERPNPEGEGKSFLLANVEFHPMLYAQHRSQPHTVHDSFDRAVDEFFSALEGQKIDLKTIQIETEAMKKLQNVRKDHDKRLTELERVQLVDRQKAELITRNQELVDQARIAIQTALANQMSWDDIKGLVKTAQERNDPVASVIKNLKLNINHISLLLTDPYVDCMASDDEFEEGMGSLKPMLIDIDLSLTAFANARRYYDQKRNAAKKQQKTLESQGIAMKSAERKTKQTLKEAQAISSISKARKTYWFEKFYWFISSDNYLVIGGRDQQQNELLVKRYLRNTDIYVHADLTGAASVLIKSPSTALPPPRTLTEAGQAAIAYSVAWEAKVLTTAWWVHAWQVSKSAPTGEYLTTGSFMIRGKKNYLLTQHLMLGFSFMFRLEDSCIERHRDERKALGVVEETSSDVASTQDQDEEIIVSDDEETSTKEEPVLLKTIEEETTRIEIKDETEDQASATEENTKENVNEKTVKEELDLDSEEDSSSEEGFPDTHIKVDHSTGKVTTESKTRTLSEVTEICDTVLDDERRLSFASLPNRKGGKKPNREENKAEKKDQSKQDGMKRGQRGKMKKIKQKYKDQDEEERIFRMEIIRAEALKDSKKAQKKNAPTSKSKSGARQNKIPQPAPLILEADSDQEPDQPDLETDTQAADAETELLSQLTGAPVPEDELLFAVPVVAPYSALHNYKYKVKLTPGTGKRGKAAKTAVQVFLRDKTCSQREKDLLKAVKDENVARNFPGKVKLSAPQLHKHKK